MQEIKPFQIERPWGNFRQFNLNTPVTVKIMTLKPHEQLSLQSHSKRSEFCHIVSGSGKMQIGEHTYEVLPGDEYTVPVEIKHRTIAGPHGISFLEVDTGKFDEDDIIRYEDKYGRT